MTQDELANLVGYSDRTAIAHIEAGKRNITQSKIVAFANALGTTPAYLMDGIKKPISSIPSNHELISNAYGKEKAELFELIIRMNIDEIEKTRQMIELMFPHLRKE